MALIKKCLLILIFALLIISINNISSAFTFELNDKSYNTDDLNIELLEKNFVFYNNANYIYIYSSDNEVYKNSNGRYGFSGTLFSYMINISTNKITKNVYEATDMQVGFFETYNILYLDYSVKDTEGKVVIPQLNGFGLELSISETNPTTNVPIVISCQNLTEDEAYKYKLYVKEGDNDYKECDIRSINFIDPEGNNSGVFYQYYYDVYYNGAFHFKFVDIESGQEIIQSVNVSNIVFTQDNVNNYIDGVFKPTPFLSYEYVSDTEIIVTTQKFYLEELEKLEASFRKDVEGEEEIWTDMQVRSFYNELARKETYQFYTSITNEDGTADGVYYFRFYNKELDDYTFATLNLNFSNIVEYQKNLEEGNSLLQKYISFFKERFGFLTYPIELVYNIYNRITTIQDGGNTIHIPDIYEPFTNTKIITATSFDFDALLFNDTLKNLHDIYLIVVDAIIVFGVSNLVYKKLMEVLA